MVVLPQGIEAEGKEHLSDGEEIGKREGNLMIYKAEVTRMWGSKAGQPYVRYWSSSSKMRKSKKVYKKRSKAQAKSSQTIKIGRELTAPEREILLLKLGRNRQGG